MDENKDQKKDRSENIKKCDDMLASLSETMKIMCYPRSRRTAILKRPYIVEHDRAECSRVLNMMGAALRAPAAGESCDQVVSSQESNDLLRIVIKR